MRLTLRALLAYLYNVLDPTDADEFAGKVQESAVASGLVQRIGGITHKMRMNAPRIDAKGMVDDANNVAQYLDNSLPEDRVGDFERACINSDIHLAEVASSYQILTMVLGKPADISEGLRTRIYTLPLDIATGHKVGASGEAAQRERLRKTVEKVAQTKETDSAVRTSSTHPVAEVPEYLRDRQKTGSALTWLAAAAAVCIVGLIGIRAAGPFDTSNPVIGWMFKPAPQVADAGKADSKDQNGPIGDQQKSSGEPVEVKKSTATPATESADDGKNSDTGAKPEEKATPATKSDEGSKAKATEPAPPSAESVAAATAEKASDTKDATKVGAAKTDTVESKPIADSAPAARPAAGIDAMDVGRYISDDQVLTRIDGKSNLWFRVPPRAILTAGERLVVLPTYRPQVALASGVQVTFAGESAVQMLEPLRAGASRMLIEHGRFLLATLGTAGAQLELNLQGVQGTLTLEDSDSVAAIDVRHYLPPGASDDKDARMLVIELFATNGRATWQETGGEPIEIPAHHVLSYVADSEPQLAGPFHSPDWLDAASLPDIDRLTSLELQKALQLDRPIHVRLEELMGDRRVDVRALAARCLGWMREFEPLIRELSNPQQKSFWAPEVEVLRQGIARGPETAEHIRQSLERLRPKEAASLYRLLRGYSPEQLEGAGSKELVEMLESPEMDVRVLASDTLRQITGAQLLYRPEKAPAENRTPINRWNERQKDGSIAYKTPPSPLPERKPLTEPAEVTKAPAGKSKEKK